MRAARTLTLDSTVIEEVPDPDCGRGEVVCRVLACATCGSDVHGWYVQRKLPAVLGHEPVGEVVEVGAGVERVAAGDVVAIHHHAACGVCRACLAGHETLCPQFRATRLDPGGFAEYVRIEAELVDELLPLDGLDPVTATCTEPLACALRAQDRVALAPRDALLVVGAGTSGLLHVGAAHARGVERVRVAESRPDRRERAVAWGAETYGDGERVDVAIVTTHAPAAVASAAAALAPGGRLCAYAPPEPGAPIAVDGAELFLRELTVTSSWSAGAADMRAALALLQSGAVRAGELITHRFALAETGAALAAQRDGTALKAVVLPWGEPCASTPHTVEFGAVVQRRRASSEARSPRSSRVEMRAAILHGPGDLRVDAIADPEPGAGEVLVRVEAATTCGTDVKMWRRGHPILPPYPAPFGHEMAGIRADSGERVLVGDSLACGRCRSCRAGRAQICRSPRWILGGFAEAIAAPEAALHAVPDGLEPAGAAMAEPLAAALHAIGRAPGRELAPDAGVLGGGPMGQTLAALLVAEGRAVTLADRHPERRAQAEELGALSAEALADHDVVFEAVGRPDAWRAAVQACAPGGCVVFAGGCAAGTDARLPTRPLHYDELDLRGAFHHAPEEIDRALALLAAGTVDWRMLATDPITLEELPAALAASNDGRARKWVVVPR